MRKTAVVVSLVAMVAALLIYASQDSSRQFVGHYLMTGKNLDWDDLDAKERAVVAQITLDLRANHTFSLTDPKPMAGDWDYRHGYLVLLPSNPGATPIPMFGSGSRLKFAGVMFLPSIHVEFYKVR